MRRSSCSRSSRSIRLLSAPLVAAALFVFGAVVYLLIVRFAVRAKANAGMVQIFSTFGLAIVMRGPGAVFLHAGLPQRHPFLARRQDGLDRRHLPARAAIDRRGGSDRGLRRALLLHQPHRFRPRARSHPRGCRRGGAGRYRQEQGVRAGLGPRRGAGRPVRRHHVDILLHLSRCRRVVRADRLCDGGARRLRQRVRRLCRRHHRRPRRGHAPRCCCRLRSRRSAFTRSISLSSSSGRAACSDRCDGYGFRQKPPPRPHRRILFSPRSQPWCRCSSRTSTSRTSWC